MTGEVVFLFAFDVASEIVLARVGTILSLKPHPFEIRAEPTYPRDVPLYRPLAVEPPPLGDLVAGRPVRLLVRVYEVGVVTVAMRVPFAVASLADLAPFHTARLDSGERLERVALGLRDAVCRDLQRAMVGASPPSEPEAYTVFCMAELEGADDANAWLARTRRQVAGLLATTEPERLSEAQITEVLRTHRSFENTDLVVIDWDAALVVDLTGYYEDVLYILELVNLQLEEFRVIDRRLDHYLNRAYEDLARAPVRFGGGAARTLRTLRRLRVDLTHLADEVTHITKFFGDWYLARVYLGARDRFALGQWRESVEQRLAQLDQLYSVAHTELNERRMLWLEVVIVVLFFVDVAAILFLRR